MTTVHIDTTKTKIINDNQDVEIESKKGSKTTTIFFSQKSDISDLTYTKENKNLIINNNGQKVTLKNYFTTSTGFTTKSPLKSIQYTNGKISIIESGVIQSKDLSYTAVPTKNGKVVGTVFSDVINMETASSYGKKKKGVTIDAKSGNDTIFGSQYDDTILGGLGTKVYNYDFGAKSGKDTIKLVKDEQLVLNLKNGNNNLDIAQLSYEKIKNDLSITFAGSQDNEIIISKFFTVDAEVSVYENSLNEYFNSNSFDGIEIISKGKIIGTNYKDTIVGSVGNDTITAGFGDDMIYTKGGKNDTVIETGEFGHDTIESKDSKKVTIKLSKFNPDNFTKDTNKNLVYTSDEKSSFVYNNFFADSSTSADLWISSNKKSYNILNKKENVDFSANKNNNVVFLTNGEYKGSKTTKGQNIIYSNGVNTYIYQGGKEIYKDNDSNDDTYNLNLTKSGSLNIEDNKGNDSIVFNNSKSDLVLFYNIDNKGNTDDNLVIYDKNGLTNKNLTSGLKTDVYTGGVNINDYFKEGNIETISYLEGDKTVEMNIADWKYYVNTFVVDWLKQNNKTSVSDVFLNGTNREKTSLLSIFKSLNYSVYKSDTDTMQKYSDITLKEQDGLLYIYGKDKETPLYPPISDFIGSDTQETLSLLVKDENNKVMTVNIDSKLNIIYDLGNNNTVDYSKFSSVSKTLRTKEGSADTIIFTDRKYSDFYTPVSDTIAYNSGDPLIIKDGNDLVIGDVIVKNSSGINSEITIKDKNNETKTIILGKGDISGTFESEIIVGSNSDDVITTNGGNDLIYMGGGNDVLNVTSTTVGTPTGKNTADMTGIGGTTTIPDNLAYPALSVYDSTGDDIYNTSFDYGLYIEDYYGDDVLNIKSSNTNVVYFFDVKNPNTTRTDYTFYTDIMIADKASFMNAITPITTALMNYMNPLLHETITLDIKSTLESLQGSFGYAWIDDYYGGNQKIETINLTNAEGTVTKTFDLDRTKEGSDVSAIYSAVATWLATTDYATAWEVLEGDNKVDMATMLSKYVYPTP